MVYELQKMTAITFCCYQMFSLLSNL